MNSTTRTFGRMELAQLYFPHLCDRSAWRKLKDCLESEPALKGLLATGRRSFLPCEVSLIFSTLGAPR